MLDRVVDNNVFIFGGMPRADGNYVSVFQWFRTDPCGSNIKCSKPFKNMGHIFQLLIFNKGYRNSINSSNNNTTIN